MCINNDLYREAAPLKSLEATNSELLSLSIYICDALQNAADSEAVALLQSHSYLPLFTPVLILIRIPSLILVQVRDSPLPLHHLSLLPLMASMFLMFPSCVVLHLSSSGTPQPV